VGGWKKTILMVITAMMAAATVLWMQGKYEASDRKNALALVQTYRPAGGPTIPDLLSKHHPSRPVSWSTAVESSCFQHVRVHAVVSDKPAGDPVVYMFTVDINGPSIHPANEDGKQLLSEMGQ
jgi:hypothetical protein